MIVSDSVAHRTGYGVQTLMLAKALVADGHRVYNYAPGAIAGGVYDVAYDADGKPTITVLSASYGDDRWGNRTVDFYLDTLQPDLILTWLDCQGLQNYGFSQIPTFMWVPVDTWPTPKQERQILHRAEKLFACSKWGQELLQGEGFPDAGYVPCGIDANVYDIDEEEGRRWRQQLTPPVTDDTFLIGMVGLNTGVPDRKGYGFAFDAIRAFIEKHPGKDIRAYLHTNALGDGQSMDLYALREEFGLLDRMYFKPPQGPVDGSDRYMRGMYNAFDVLLHTSMTEGFGVPVVEAQMCGTPVVVNAATSVTELATGGYKAHPLTHMWVNTGTKVAIPDVQGLVQMLEAAYADRLNHSRLATRANVMRYDFQRVYEEYWRPLLAEVPQPVDYENTGPKKLMLAAGKKQKEGFARHDRVLAPGIDFAHDLNVFPYPWADDEWDYIEFVDCIEHLKADLVPVMDELWRILKPTGHLYIHTAQIGSWQLFLDPTHVRGFDMHSFDYFDPKTRWGGESDYDDYTDKKWQIIHRTSDNVGGLMFLMRPRKEALVEA